MQVKLLRALQEGEIDPVGSKRPVRVDVRIVSATNRDLAQQVAESRFREDLYYRLNVFPIEAPSLRERREDIPALAAHFLSRYATRYRRPVEGFDPPALQVLLSHVWPGNVRELDHTMERAVLMARSSHVGIADLGLNTQRPGSQTLDDMSLETVEAILIQKALARSQGNVTQAAEALGLSRGALYRRMEKYGL
jgi:DNA-binding NtrC family response regulator